MTIYFIIIKHTRINHVYTHTLMFGQLHTQTEFVSIPLSTFMSTFGHLYIFCKVLGMSR